MNKDLQALDKAIKDSAGSFVDNGSKTPRNSKMSSTISSLLEQDGRMSKQARETIRNSYGWETNAGKTRKFRLCRHCKSTGNGFKRCSRCKQVYYCSEECQKKDWRRHKRTCTIYSETQ